MSMTDYEQIVREAVEKGQTDYYNDHRATATMGQMITRAVMKAIGPYLPTQETPHD